VTEDDDAEGTGEFGTGEFGPPDELLDPAAAEFNGFVDSAISEIPPPFADELYTVAIVVDDEPAPGQSPPGQTLLGLYSGVPRTSWGADGVPFPSKITIFRGPHERAYRNPEARARAVEETVFHEVAHHFGISDQRLRDLQAGRARPNR
jgi:predicted Zn-dependent protease with MMP-like domain